MPLRDRGRMLYLHVRRFKLMAPPIVADRSGSYESPANHQPSATDLTKAREKVRKRYDLDSPSDSGARA